jgi:predicted porin
MILMLVVLTAMVAGVSNAGDYTFYGKLHSSINMLSNGENSQLGLTTNTSRFGFKGTNPLNDSFTFVWQFERSLNMTSTGSDLSVRNSFVGFKNADFGEVRMGRHDTPHKTLGRKTTFFFDTIGDNRQMTFGTDTRESQILAWVSPNWSGFGLFLAYQFDQDSTKLTSNDPDAEFMAMTLFSGMATYSKDAFLVGASWIMPMGDGYKEMGGTAGDELGDAPMIMRFAGKYNAEKFGLCASYLNLKENSWDGTDWVDYKANTIGFEGLFKASEKYSIKAGYYIANPWTDAEDVDGTDLDESDVKYSMMTFGVDRNFGKSTQIYIQYAALSYGDATPNYGMGVGGNGFGKSWFGWEGNEDGTVSNPNGFSMGVNYSW